MKDNEKPMLITEDKLYYESVTNPENAMHNLYFALYISFCDSDTYRFAVLDCHRIVLMKDAEITYEICRLLKQIEHIETPAEAMQAILNKYDLPECLRPAIDKILSIKAA